MEFSLEHTPALSNRTIEWDFDLDQDPIALENAMISFMIKNHGIGLAANQIGLDKRVFVIGGSTLEKFQIPVAIFNPGIIESSKDLAEDQEGCLSFPGLWLKVKRPRWIVAAYHTADGVYKEHRLEGYESKCYQHELDHLDGICFVDRVSKLKLQLALKKQRKNR